MVHVTLHKNETRLCKLQWQNDWETMVDWEETVVDWRRSELGQKNSVPQERKRGKKPSGKNSPRTQRGRLKTNSADEASLFSLNAARASPKANNLPSYHTRANHATSEQPVKAFKQAVSPWVVRSSAVNLAQQ